MQNKPKLIWMTASMWRLSPIWSLILLPKSLMILVNYSWIFLIIPLYIQENALLEEAAEQSMDDDYRIDIIESEEYV